MFKRAPLAARRLASQDVAALLPSGTCFDCRPFPTLIYLSERPCRPAGVSGAKSPFDGLTAPLNGSKIAKMNGR